MVFVAEKDDSSTDQSTRGLVTMGCRLLANIGRILWEGQRSGSRCDGAVKNLRLIREPVGRGVGLR